MPSDLPVAQALTTRAERRGLVLSFTKATCDAFIGMAAELSAVAGQETLANRVKAGYGVAGAVVTTVKSGMAGERVDLERQRWVPLPMQ